MLTRNNPTAIDWWFSNFKDVYDYCESVYLIHDKKFVDKLLEHSRKPLNSKDNIISYMNLALEYWDMKTKVLRDNGVID